MRLRPAGGVARREHATEHGLLARQFRRQLLLPRAEARQFGLRRASLGLQPAQAAVGVGNRALGVAQRVARLAPVGFLLAQAGAQRLDARAQRLQVFLAAGLRRGARGERQAEEQRPDQGLAFPCAETAATRRATSAASPR